MTPIPFTIDRSEPFPHLSQAPVVEAVIEFRTPATSNIEEGSSRGHFESRLTGYAFLDSSRLFQHHSFFEEGAWKTKVEDIGWKGMRFQSDDETRILQLNRDGFVFSRLAPYTDWSTFCDEALALWEVFRAVASPTDVQRTGLRYINRIPLPPGSTDLDRVLQKGPTLPEGLPLPVLEFHQQETLVVLETAYLIRLARSMAPILPGTDPALGIIVDIDVFCGRATEPTTEVLRPILEDLRWLKNKAFFGTLTRETLERLK